MYYIVIGDYLLLLPYLFIFFLLARRLSKNEEPALRIYMLNAFFLRMLGCLLYSMVTQYYYGYGDSFTFFKGGNFFTDRISDDFSNIRYLFAPNDEIREWYNASPNSDVEFSGYFSNPSGNLVMKISAVLSYLSFNRFLIVSLFFGFFSFVGQWKLFTVFDKINNKLHRKLLAIVVLYSPSIWFWGSGLMKDSLCLGAFGLVVYILYNFKEKKTISLLNIIYLAILIYLIAVIKSYIINVFIIAIILTLFYLFIKKLKNLFIRIAVVVMLLLGVTLAGMQYDFSAMASEKAEDLATQIQIFKEDYQNASEEEDSKGGFSLSDFDPSFEGILMRTPVVIFSCLYRPFLWESRKVMILFTSLESTLLLLASLYLLIKSKLFGFFRIILANEFLFFCFALSLVFAAVIGFTTFNFGTMTRYKIIFLPFFYFLLVGIYTKLNAPVEVKEKNT